jgi:hypothetical protein
VNRIKWLVGQEDELLIEVLSRYALSFVTLSYSNDSKLFDVIYVNCLVDRE